MNLKSLFKRPLILLGVGAIGAILAPVGVNAAGKAIKLKGVDTSNGKVHVSDGDGPMTIDGNVNIPPIPIPNDPEPPGRVLAAGDCDGNPSDDFPVGATVPAGSTVLGITLTTDTTASGIANLGVGSAESPNPSGQFFRLQVSNDAGYAKQDQLEFGPGIRLSSAWGLSCGLPNVGIWVVYGR